MSINIYPNIGLAGTRTLFNFGLAPEEFLTIIIIYKYVIINIPRFSCVSSPERNVFVGYLENFFPILMPEDVSRFSYPTPFIYDVRGGFLCQLKGLSEFMADCITFKASPLHCNVFVLLLPWRGR